MRSRVGGFICGSVSWGPSSAAGCVNRTMRVLDKDIKWNQGRVPPPRPALLLSLQTLPPPHNQHGLPEQRGPLPLRLLRRAALPRLRVMGMSRLHCPGFTQSSMFLTAGPTPVLLVGRVYFRPTHRDGSDTLPHPPTSYFTGPSRTSRPAGGPSSWTLTLKLFN